MQLLVTCIDKLSPEKVAAIKKQYEEIRALAASAGLELEPLPVDANGKPAPAAAAARPTAPPAPAPKPAAAAAPAAPAVDPNAPKVIEFDAGSGKVGAHACHVLDRFGWCCVG